MKILIFIFFCLHTSVSFAGDFLTFQEFKRLSPEKKVQVLEAYKTFVKEIIKNTDVLDNEEFVSKIDFLFFEEAYASEGFNCFYAGWPSKKKSIKVSGKTKTVCSSPANSNPIYKVLSSTCGSEKMLCQPLLFGKDVCIETKTQAQKNSSFSQCQQKFLASGKSMDDLSRDLTQTEFAPLADEMFSLVNDICSSGFQSKTGMCGNLKKRVAELMDRKPKEIVTENEKKEANSKNDFTVIDDGEVSENVELKNELVKTVDLVNKAPATTKENSSNTVVCTQCELLKQIEKKDEVLVNHEASESIDQNQKTKKDFCAGGQSGTNLDKYSQGAYSGSDDGVSVDIMYQEKDKDRQNRVPGGFDINLDHMGPSSSYIEDGVEYSPDEMEPMYPKRVLTNEYLARGKEGSFDVIDSPVRVNYVGKSDKIYNRFISTDMRITQYAFFPRKIVPSVKVRDDKILMTLTTGEEIAVDKKSGRIVAGAAKEVSPKNQVENRLDSKGNKNVRTYPDSDFSYEGKGLFIISKLTSNRDERKPGSIVPVRAIVDGKVQECKVKSEDIWVHDYGYYLQEDHEKYLSSYWSCTRFKFEKDEELYKLVKTKCPDFKFPDLTK